jgi:hypothetical protein
MLDVRLGGPSVTMGFTTPSVWLGPNYAAPLKYPTAALSRSTSSRKVLNPTLQRGQSRPRITPVDEQSIRAGVLSSNGTRQIPHFLSCFASRASYSSCLSPVRRSRDAARRHTRHHGVRQDRRRRSRGYQEGSRSVWHLVHLIVGLVVNWSINSYFLELVNLELTSSVFSAAGGSNTTDQRVTSRGGTVSKPGAHR